VQSTTATLEQRRPEKLGTQIGSYKLHEKIGEAGMGIVCAAEQTSFSRRVALKILPSASLWSENALERFRKVVRITATLEHPNFVPIYEMGYEQSVHFYAMKLVDGCSLAEVITHRGQETAKQASDANDSPASAETVVAAVT